MLPIGYESSQNFVLEQLPPSQENQVPRITAAILKIIQVLPDTKSSTFSSTQIKITAVTIKEPALYAIVHTISGHKSNELFWGIPQNNRLISGTFPITFCHEYIHSLAVQEDGSFICYDDQTVHQFKIEGNQIKHGCSFTFSPSEILAQLTLNHEPFNAIQIRHVQIMPQNHWLILIDYKKRGEYCLEIYDPSAAAPITIERYVWDVIAVQYALGEIYLLIGNHNRFSNEIHATTLQMYNPNNQENNRVDATYEGHYSKIVSEDQIMLLSENNYEHIIIMMKSDDSITQRKEKVNGICHPCIDNRQIVILRSSSVLLLDPLLRTSVNVPLITLDSSLNIKKLSSHQWTLQKKEKNTFLAYGTKKIFTINLSAQSASAI